MLVTGPMLSATTSTLRENSPLEVSPKQGMPWAWTPKDIVERMKSPKRQVGKDEAGRQGMVAKRIWHLEYGQNNPPKLYNQPINL